MKKMLVVSLAFLLVACGNDDTEDGQVTKEELPIIETSIEKETISNQENEKTKSDEPLDEEIDKNPKERIVLEQPKMISRVEFKEMIDYNMLSDGDELLSYSAEENHLKAVVKIEEGMLGDDLSAATSYSSLSDELLTHEGWDILTVEFVDVGTISMGRNKKETNEMGSYFPIIKIEEKLKK